MIYILIERYIDRRNWKKSPFATGSKMDALCGEGLLVIWGKLRVAVNFLQKSFLYRYRYSFVIRQVVQCKNMFLVLSNLDEIGFNVYVSSPKVHMKKGRC